MVRLYYQAHCYSMLRDVDRSAASVAFRACMRGSINRWPCRSPIVSPPTTRHRNVGGWWPEKKSATIARRCGITADMIGTSQTGNRAAEPRKPEKRRPRRIGRDPTGGAAFFYITLFFYVRFSAPNFNRRHALFDYSFSLFTLNFSIMAYRLPAEISAFQKSQNLKFQTIFSTNPKTEKSEYPTIILHLLPHDLSGKNVCPSAGNCKKICLNFAGNPAYLNTKLAARLRKTVAYFQNREQFMQLLVLGIVHAYYKNNKQKIAVRLNGTSDILWENIPVTVTPAMAAYMHSNFRFNAYSGKFSSIFEFFRSNLMQPDRIQFYDYTKTPRDFAKCRELNYHLTFSFDGWSNKQNVENCKTALENGVNVAAAFNLKRGADLPHYFKASQFFGDSVADRVLAIYDGDLSDYRPADPSYGTIIGLRFKLPHGADYTAQDVQNFCIA